MKQNKKKFFNCAIGIFWIFMGSLMIYLTLKEIIKLTERGYLHKVVKYYEFTVEGVDAILILSAQIGFGILAIIIGYSYWKVLKK